MTSGGGHHHRGSGSGSECEAAHGVDVGQSRVWGSRSCRPCRARHTRVAGPAVGSFAQRQGDKWVGQPREGRRRQLGGQRQAAIGRLGPQPRRHRCARAAPASPRSTLPALAAAAVAASPALSPRPHSLRHRRHGAVTVAGTSSAISSPAAPPAVSNKHELPGPAPPPQLRHPDNMRPRTTTATVAPGAINPSPQRWGAV